VKMATCLLLCALITEGLCVARYCVFRLSRARSGRNPFGERTIKCLAVGVNLAFMGLAIMTLMSYIRNKVEFRDTAVLIGLSVMTEKMGHAPLEVHWSECKGSVRVMPSNGECTNECACIQLMRDPFGVYVR